MDKSFYKTCSGCGLPIYPLHGYHTIQKSTGDEYRHQQCIHKPMVKNIKMECFGCPDKQGFACDGCSLEYECCEVCQKIRAFRDIK